MNEFKKDEIPVASNQTNIAPQTEYKSTPDKIENYNSNYSISSYKFDGSPTFFV